MFEEVQKNRRNAVWLLTDEQILERVQAFAEVNGPAETKDGHINHDSLKLQHKNALRLAKIRPFEVYCIRHTFLTRLGESGCDVWTLARIAGRSNISISQRYVHPSEDAVLNALSRLSGHKSGHSTEKAISAGSEELVLKSTGTEGKVVSAEGIEPSTY